MGFLWRAQLLLIVPVVLYVCFLGVLTVPAVQRALIFVSWANFPPGRLDRPERFGFGLGQVRNLNVSTSDGLYIGAWHVLPYDIWTASVDKHGHVRELPASVYDDALTSRSTMLYAHGNAGNRATGHRQSVARFVTRLGVNLIIFDYRGFGDSSKVVIPSEQGLVTDARAAWDWLSAKGARPHQVVLAGQSLGTGVISALAANLASEGTMPRALVLIAPFTSIAHLLETYKLGTVIPLLGPVTVLPAAHKLLLSLLTIQFDTRAILKTVRSPIMLIHARNDRDIPSQHSEALFDDLTSGAEISETKLSEDNARMRRAGKVTLVQPAFGGHNAVGYSETALLCMRELFE